VGRILSRYGRIDKKTSQKKRRAQKYKGRRRRWPRELVARRAGDLIQIDTKHVMLPWSERRYQFVAIDVATKLKVTYIAKTASSRRAAAFLGLVIARFPFEVKAVQTDNGSEFLGEFDQVLSAARIAHFFTYPNCPKQNAVVERAILTEIREFHDRAEPPAEIDEHNDLLVAWDRFYNEVRPHQSLGYLTPMAYHEALLAEAQPARPVVVPIYVAR
jgi:transposase InsO family protein